jgi:tetratricopeptide (TPR) repeat protein
MRIILAGLIALPLAISGCFPVDPLYEAKTLSGEPLMRIAPPAQKRAELWQNVGAAASEWQERPSEASALALGRAYAAYGQYQNAISAYSSGLERCPDSHRLLRHRGHRYITVHKLREASRDLERAWSLAKNQPDALESADGSSTDKSAILYHYGLSEYLRGDYRHADEVFKLRDGLPTLKDENVVSAASWHYWALRREGRAADAARVIEPIRNGMDVKENKSYYTLCRLYRGLLPVAEVEKQMVGEDGKLNVGLAYGVACWKRFELKDEAGARALLERIVATGNWTAFGEIAAEADLARWPG